MLTSQIEVVSLSLIPYSCEATMFIKLIGKQLPSHQFKLYELKLYNISNHINISSNNSIIVINTKQINVLPKFAFVFISILLL